MYRVEVVTLYDNVPLSLMMQTLSLNNFLSHSGVSSVHVESVIHNHYIIINYNYTCIHIDAH